MADKLIPFDFDAARRGAKFKHVTGVYPLHCRFNENTLLIRWHPNGIHHTYSREVAEKFLRMVVSEEESSKAKAWINVWWDKTDKQIRLVNCNTEEEKENDAKDNGDGRFVLINTLPLEYTIPI